MTIKATREINDLLAIMARLRDPDDGCPWDLEQTFETIAPYTIEEAYEVADAIHRGERTHLRDELGDLLFQAVYHAQMAKEEGAFDFGDVVRAISDKMIRRHPHVFGDAVVESADAQTAHWEAVKAAERAGKAAESVLDDVPVALPALVRAEKLQKRAARVGFDWDDPGAVLDKIHEESAELIEARDQGPERAADEFGDLLFAVVNLGRHLGIDAEAALSATNRKFDRRFRSIEAALATEGRGPENASLAEMEALWVAAKAAEKT